MAYGHSQIPGHSEHPQGRQKISSGLEGTGTQLSTTAESQLVEPGTRKAGHEWVTESQNGLCSRDLKGHLVPPPCHGQGHLLSDQVPPNPVQPDLRAASFPSNLWQSLTTLTELLPSISCNTPSGNGIPFPLILTLHPSYPIYSQPHDSNSSAIPAWDSFSVSVSPQQQKIALESSSPGCQPGSATMMLICCHQQPPSRQTGAAEASGVEQQGMVLAGTPGLTACIRESCTGKDQTGKGGRRILAHSSVVMQAPGLTCQGAREGSAGGSSSPP